MSELLQLDSVATLLPSEDADCFRDRVSDLLGRRTRNFPGAQPVSFARRHFQELRRTDYYLCEKTDGIRCLLYMTFLILEGVRKKANFLIDRKNDYYYIQNEKLEFPLPGHDSKSYHVDTLLDGELVLDTEPDGTTVKRYLVFDCLAMDGKALLDRPLDKRIGYAGMNVIDPYKKLLMSEPAKKYQQPFEVHFKKLEKAYGIEAMFRQVLPALKHGNDGLVFTCVSSSYTTGTDQHILKWKPPHENTVDFRLQLGDFPRLDHSDAHDAEPDYDACPPMSLLVNKGRGINEHFAQLHVTDSEWQAMKSLNQMLDGRIIECYRDPDRGWRFKAEKSGVPRFRDDKTEANHISTVDSVLESIEDAVTEHNLRGQAKAINVAWKEREKRRKEEELAQREMEARRMARENEARAAAKSRAAAQEKKSEPEPSAGPVAAAPDDTINMDE